MTGGDQNPKYDPMERTVVIPRPGNAPGFSSAAPISQTSSHEARSGESFDPSAYPNPLVRAAGPVLISATQLRGTISNSDPATVRSRIATEIRAFETNAKAFGVAKTQIDAARYILCTFLDEVVMSTPWGLESGWSQRSLLSEFHGETFGGEKVFAVIDKARNEPGTYYSLLELSYIVLSLGFQGQYRVRQGGTLKNIQDNLYQTLRRQKPIGEKTLSPNWRGMEEARADRFMKIVPFWVIALGGLMVLGAIYVGFSSMLNNARDPVYRVAEEIEKEGGDLIASAPAPLVAPFDLEARLAPYVGNGLDVDIRAGVASINIRGSQSQTPLFQSGRANIHRRAIPMLEKIAAVLTDVPGDVTITGHTDAQGRITSNQRLSVLRARAVRHWLVENKVALDRFETRGVGSSEPAIPNERTAADRATNRRVEIRFRVPDGMEGSLR